MTTCQLNKVELREFIEALSSLGSYLREVNGAPVKYTNKFSADTTVSIAKNKVYLFKKQTEAMEVHESLPDVESKNQFALEKDEYQLHPIPYEELKGATIDPNALAVLSPIVEGF